MTDRVGQQLGNYRLVRLLGQGGFADVYLGEHIYLKTSAAIKVLQMRLTNEDMEGFLNEARTIAGLRHAHIVRVLDFGVDDSTPFLVMDYAPMGTLRQRHAKGTRLPTSTILSYVKQVSAALQYAHDKKLIHRDIKPENMLLESDNDIVLSDFGIATAAQSSRYQSTQEAIGTLAYMSPEQLQGKPRIASDQYSLGIVVYEWLTGDRPFHGSFIEMASQHMLVPPPPLREKFSELPAALEEVVLTALAKDPQQRFKSIQAFATAFEQACQSGQLRPITASSESLPPTIVINPPSQPLAPTIVAPPPKSFPPTVKASTPKAGSQSPGTNLLTYYGHSDLVYAIAWSPDGKRIASCSNDVQVWNAATGDNIFTYSNHSDWVNSIAWSPDGKRIASVSDDRKLQVWNAATGRTIFIYNGHFDWAYSVAWSPNGTYIASASKDGMVHVLDATDGECLKRHSGHSSFWHRKAVNSVAWSPDGTRIASAGDDRTVQIWEFPIMNRALTYRSHSKEVLILAWSPDGKHIASAGNDQIVRIWDAFTGVDSFSCDGHSASVTTVAWAPNGRYLLSASDDETVQVWDAFTGANYFTYHDHSEAVWSAAWSPDGKRIASGSFGEVHVWQAV